MNSASLLARTSTDWCFLHYRDSENGKPQQREVCRHGAAR